MIHGEVVHYDAPFAKRDVITIDNRMMHDRLLYNQLTYQTPKYVPMGNLHTRI